MNLDVIYRLRPRLEALDRNWSHDTLTSILASEQSSARSRRSPRRRFALVSAASAGIALGAATAAAAAGVMTPAGLLDSFSDESGRDVGTIAEPVLVADFTTTVGSHFALWTSTTSRGESCSVAYRDPNGSTPSSAALAYGCDPTPVGEVGGFFNDADGPMVYGISPYDKATEARVTGDGVHSTLPIRQDSHGYGAALPGAGSTRTVEVTFVDASGHVLGRKTLVAPEG